MDMCDQAAATKQASVGAVRGGREGGREGRVEGKEEREA
jgi:hypothetical protein